MLYLKCYKISYLLIPSGTLAFNSCIFYVLDDLFRQLVFLNVFIWVIFVGDLLALTCTEELNITTANTDLTKLQSVTTTTATSASLLAKHVMNTQLSIPSSSTGLTGTTSTTSGGSMWTSKPSNTTAMPSTSLDLCLYHKP